MKKNKLIALSVVPVALASGLLVSCQTGPPSRLESKFFDITTNYVPQVVVVTNVTPVYLTNVVTIQQTNVMVDKRVEVYPVTNLTTLITYKTNYELATNYIPAYTFTPNTNAATVVETGKAAGDLFGFGGIVAAILGGAFGLYGKMRSTKALNTAGVLAQVIQVGRDILKTTPQGQALDSQWKNWMIQHQLETGVIQQVVGLLDRVVDDESAREVAAEIAKLIQTPKP